MTSLEHGWGSLTTSHIEGVLEETQERLNNNLADITLPFEKILVDLASSWRVVQEIEKSRPLQTYEYDNLVRLYLRHDGWCLNLSSHSWRGPLDEVLRKAVIYVRMRLREMTEDLARKRESLNASTLRAAIARLVETTRV